MATFPASGVLVSDSIVPRSQGAFNTYEIKRQFDLTSLLAALIANADVDNLFNLPANFVILAASLSVVTPGTKNATAFTLQLRLGATALTAALDVTAAAGTAAVGGNATYNMPLAVGGAAAAINLLAAVTGGAALATLNPVVQVKLVVSDMS